jgi:hypothetical protein
MLTWYEFETAQPQLAEGGRALLYQVGVGLAFLSTVRKDGGPRVHPMCPLIMDGRLLAFLIPSPKANDLRRDPRFAMHSFPTDSNEDAVYLTGEASLSRDPALREAAGKLFWEERPTIPVAPDFGEQRLFEFFIESAMLTRTTGHGDPSPVHTIWRP